MTSRKGHAARVSLAALLALAGWGWYGGAVRPADAASMDAEPAQQGRIQVYGAWHCSSDACDWYTVRDMGEFDRANRWLVDRGDGRPSVNYVVLAFVNPRKLLHRTTDAQNVAGLKRGMTPEVVRYFKSRGIRVSLSIGGVTYREDWNRALAENPRQLGLNAAELARRLGVGIEIDYEENREPNLAGLQRFIDAYRSVHPYDASGRNHAARLTIDLAAGTYWLAPLAQKAARDWLRTDRPVLDFANAMVPETQPAASEAIASWTQHVQGRQANVGVIPPVAPAKLTASVFLVHATSPSSECVDFTRSLQNTTSRWVQTVAPRGSGSTPGLLGYMFWAAERPRPRHISTAPPNSCERGVGAGARALNVPIPMPALRQR